MARFTDKTIDEIKSRVTITDVMSNYAQVVHRGGRDWVKCPFHGGGNEKTPSCTIDNSTGRYYCFGCHASGDIFTLVQEKEGIDFTSAVEMLAAKAGVELETAEGPRTNKDHDTKQMLYDVYSRISKTFNYLLKTHPDAAEAREYLKKRSVSDEMIDTFQLGFAPKDGRWLYRFLRSKDYSDEFLSSSGLFSQNYKGLSLFTNRLMFPIRDKNGRVLAFSGRDLSGTSKAKYINSPETRIYQKKENFFGLFEAKKHISSGVQPILCEGNFDVVAMHQAGFTSAIASLGTAFTPEQLNNLVRWYSKVKEFHLLFDSDEAGQIETAKAIQMVHSIGLEVYVHGFTSAKDASELLEKDGKEGVEKEFAKSVTGFEYLVQRARNSYNITNAKGKSDFVKSLAEFILSTQSSVERDSYILQIASILGTSEQNVKADLNVSQNRKVQIREKEEDKEIDYGIPRHTYDLFAVLFLVNHRDAFKTYRRKLQIGDLEDTEAQVIYMALENAMRNDIRTPELLLSTITDDKIRNDVATSFALPEYTADDYQALDEAIMRIQVRSLEKQREILTNQLMLIPDTAEPDEAISLLEKKKDIDGNIRILKEELLKREGREA